MKFVISEYMDGVKFTYATPSDHGGGYKVFYKNSIRMLNNSHWGVNIRSYLLNTLKVGYFLMPKSQVLAVYDSYRFSKR